jgi:hypothetical protein
MQGQRPQGGRIINMGSISAKTPRADSLPYTTTKYALQGMTHQLTMDGRKHNIVASIIHPGATLSSFITRTGVTKAGPGERPEDYVMEAADVAKVAVLMASLPPEGGDSHSSLPHLIRQSMRHRRISMDDRVKPGGDELKSKNSPISRSPNDGFRSSSTHPTGAFSSISQSTR